MINYNSPEAIATYLEDHGLAMNKKLGQNFLIAPHVREKIAEVLDASSGDSVWEVGPGIGAMTSQFVKKGYNLTLFELDHGFCRILRDEYGEDAFTLVEGDALKLWKPYHKEHGAPKVLMGNLPYNVGSQLITDLMQGGCVADQMVFMLQKEVCQRMMAQPNTKLYSTFTAICQYNCKITYLGDVPAGCFYPAPMVTSGVVELRPNTDIPRAKNESLFYRLLKDLYLSRRKTIKNSLLRGSALNHGGVEVVEEVLKAEQISPEARGEALSLTQIINLADRIDSLKS